MSLEQVVLFKKIIVILIPILAIILLMKTNWKESASKVSDVGNDFAGRILKKSKLNYLKYDSIQKFLNTKGATYMFGEAANPVNYMLIKILVLLLLFMVGMSFDGILLASLLGASGFFLPDILLTISNSSDNDAMLEDIKCV